MGGVGRQRERGRPVRELLQMSRMDTLVAWPGAVVVEIKRGKEKWIQAALRGKTWQAGFSGTGK